jgi:hypothetical protein
MPAAFRLLSGIGRKLITDLLPAALASGLVGLIFSHLVNSPAPHANAADIERVVHDAQEIARDYTRKEEDLRRQMAMISVPVRPVTPAESVTAKQDSGPSRDARPTVASAPREATAKVSAPRESTAKKTEQQLASLAQQKPAFAAAPVAEKPLPVEPLVLSSVTTTPPTPAKPENFLTSTWQGVVSVVKKVPDWAASAADFALELSPTRSITESHLRGRI